MQMKLIPCAFQKDNIKLVTRNDRFDRDCSVETCMSDQSQLIAETTKTKTASHLCYDIVPLNPMCSQASELKQR